MATFLTDKAPFFLNDDATGTSGSLTVGYTEMRPEASAAAFTLPQPYVGAQIIAYLTGTATAMTVVTDATSTTLNNQGDRTITFSAEGEFVSLVGKSTTRWVLVGQNGVVTS